MSEHDFDGDDDIFSKSGRFGGPSTGKPISSARTWHYPSQYTILSDDATSSGVKRGARCRIDKRDCDHALVTSRGVQPGDSWGDFVKRYGDVTAYEITVDDNESGRDDSYMSDEDQAAASDLREQHGITIDDFDRDYIQTGKVDLSRNRLTVRFRAVLYDTTVLYTEADQWGGYLDSTQERHWRIGGRYGTMLAPNRQSFNLEFEFANSATWEGLGDGDLISISSSLYN